MYCINVFCLDSNKNIFVELSISAGTPKWLNSYSEESPRNINICTFIFPKPKHAGILLKALCLCWIIFTWNKVPAVFDKWRSCVWTFHHDSAARRLPVVRQNFNESGEPRSYFKASTRLKNAARQIISCRLDLRGSSFPASAFSYQHVFCLDSLHGSFCTPRCIREKSESSRTTPWW